MGGERGKGTPFVVQATVEKRVGHRPHGGVRLFGCFFRIGRIVDPNRSGNGTSHGSESHDIGNETIHDNRQRSDGEWGRRLKDYI
jgi:hypothetical protein